MVMPTTTNISGLVHATREHPIINLLNMQICTKIGSADTDGAYTLIEYTAPPHFHGTAPHCHQYTTEWLYIVDGMLVITRGEETTTATRGTSLLIPPGVPHTFWNPTAAAVTFLALYSPGGIERYWEELAALNTSRLANPVTNVALDAAYDMRWLDL